MCGSLVITLIITIRLTLSLNLLLLPIIIILLLMWLIERICLLWLIMLLCRIVTLVELQHRCQINHLQLGRMRALSTSRVPSSSPLRYIWVCLPQLPPITIRHSLSVMSHPTLVLRHIYGKKRNKAMNESVIWTFHQTSCVHIIKLSQLALSQLQNNQIEPKPTLNNNASNNNPI